MSVPSPGGLTGSGGYNGGVGASRRGGGGSEGWGKKRGQRCPGRAFWFRPCQGSDRLLVGGRDTRELRDPRAGSETMPLLPSPGPGSTSACGEVPRGS